MLTPKIGLSGVFKFLPPYDESVEADQELKVVGIRDLSEMVASKENPLENVYKNHDLSNEDLLEDIDAGIPIVVFTTTSNKYYYVPADRIGSFPVNTGKFYQEKVIAINLGSIPVDLNIEPLLNDLANFVESKVGIRTTAKAVKSSAVIMVDDTEHLKIEAIRQSRITNRESDLIKLRRCLKREQELKNVAGCVVEKLNA